MNALQLRRGEFSHKETL